MNQDMPPAVQQRPPRVYSEEEQCLRWACIIKVILNDLSTKGSSKPAMTATGADATEQQTVS